MQSWRLLTSSVNDPYKNMALDEALLIACEKGLSPPTLRFYSWHPSAITTGYSYQGIEKEIDIAQLKSLKIPLVRRPTGGGILFHHKDISYSVVFNKTYGGLSRPIESYRIIHNCFLDSFKIIGLKAGLRSYERSSTRNNLCFLTHARFEVMVSNKKVLGSAQRWLRNSFLQHGSIFLEPPSSEILRPFKGLDKEEVFRSIFWLKDAMALNRINDIVESFIKHFSFALRIKFTAGGLTPFEELCLNRLLREKYSRDSWNIRGERPCDLASTS